MKEGRRAEGAAVAVVVVLLDAYTRLSRTSARSFVARDRLGRSDLSSCWQFLAVAAFPVSTSSELAAKTSSSV